MIEPKLRFKADDGSQFPGWEEKVFGDFVDTHFEKTSDKDKYPLYSLTIESGVQPKTDRYEREFLVKKEGDNYKIVPPNAFVYNPMNLRFGALKVNHEKFSVSVSGYYDVFSLKDDSVLAFWENYLVTSKMLNYYFSIATGSLIEKLRVHYSQFVKIKKPLPSLPEQQKIAEFLSTIDTVIEKQKETVSAWEECKKGVMQKLFSQEVRFKADDGSDFPEWEEKKLGDVCEYRKGQSVGVNYVGTENMNQNFSGVDSLDSTNEVNGVIYCVGDTLMSNIRPYLKKTWKADRNGVCSTDVLVFRPVNIDSDFLYYNISSEKFVLYVMTGVKGSKMPRGDKGHIMEYNIPIPCLAEQQKIVDCLSSLDEVIEKQKATLAAWEELKKGLLQQMFI